MDVTFENITYNELEEKYGAILNKDRPKIEMPALPNFFDISGYAHYENTISNWYAFFFRHDGPHGFKMLFADTICEIINKKKRFSFEMSLLHCSAEREYNVEGKFIDILLYDSEDNGAFNNAIIIENKINADLYNDLDIYYSEINTAKNKCGVVLSKNKHSELPDGYINITHFELIDAIRSNLGKYLHSVNEKYLFYLKDFIQQIQSLFPSKNMNDIIKYYCQNVKEIDELCVLKEKAIGSVLAEIYPLIPSPFFKGGVQKDCFQIKNDFDQNVLMDFTFDTLFTENTFYFNLWLSSKYLALVDSPVWGKAKRIKIPPQFEFSVHKHGYSLFVGCQRVELPKGANFSEVLPHVVHSELENNWEPFLKELLIIIND